MIGMSTNDGATETTKSTAKCDLDAAYHDYLCNGMCAPACLNSEAFQQTSGSDEADGGQQEEDQDNDQDDDMDFTGMCEDECFPTMADKLSVLVNAMDNCEEGADHGAWGSANDEAGYYDDDGSEQSDHAPQDDDGEPSQGDTLGEQLDQTVDMMSFMCTKNAKGENCMNAMKVVDQYHNETDMDEDDDDGLADITCEDAEMVSLLSVGCCFATMIQEMTSGMDSDDAKRAAEAENEFDMLEDFTMVYKGCGGSLVPCGENAMSDMAVVESSIVFDGIDESTFKNKTKRKNMRQIIAKESGNGVTAGSVLITGMTTTAASRRSLNGGDRLLAAAGVKIEYQITVPAAKKDAVTTKVTTGLDITKLKAAAPELAAATIKPATTVVVEASTAKVPPAPAPTEDREETTLTSGGGKDVLSFVAAGAILACTAALAAH